MSFADQRIAVVGATGAVGIELLALLARAGVPVANVRACASARSAGRELVYGEGVLVVEPLSDASLDSVDLAFLTTPAAEARRWAQRFVSSGAVVVDNSSAFRMDSAVDLIVPEVNGELAIRRTEPRIIANPNCSTILLLVATTPLQRRFGCKKLIVSTYQAVSGAGLAAVEELESQTRDVLAGNRPVPEAFPEPCAFNVFSHDSPVDPSTGANVEETKMEEETRKIWGTSVELVATCVRVPVARVHCESVHMTLETPASEAAVREALAGAPGVSIVDERATGKFPTALAAAKRHTVLVGRIRPDPGTAAGDGRFGAFSLFLAGDQLLKGAALNAFQIAELALRTD